MSAVSHHLVNQFDSRMLEPMEGQSNLQMYPNPGASRGMVKVYEQKGTYYGYAPSPPLRVKDIIFSPQYARGQTTHQMGFMWAGNQVLHQMYDHVSGTTFYQGYSAKGGQGEGF